MTRIFYGGNTSIGPLGAPAGAPPGAGFIELEILKTLHMSRQPIYDGPTLLYHSWTIEVIAQVSPGATSYLIPGVGGNPLPLKGNTPANTDIAIRDRLLTPRKQLVVVVGGDYLLISPPPNLEYDAQLGPMPYRADILEIAGDRRFVFRWGIRTCVNPCASVVNKQAITLSHRWSQSKTIDQDGFAQLVTNGHAIFDTGKLSAGGVIPDDLFDNFARPLEMGFRRDNVDVTAHEDGSMLRYTLTDRQTPMTLAKSYGLLCSRIECTHASSIQRIGGLQGAEEGFEKGITLGRSLAGSASDALGLGALTGFGITLGSGIAGATLGFARGSVPTQIHMTTVRVWGHPNSTKQNLEFIGQRIVEVLLINSGFGKFWQEISGFTITVTRDVNGRWVETSATYRSPPVKNVIDAIAGVLGKTVTIGGLVVAPGDKLFWPKTPNVDDVIFQNQGNNDQDKILLAAEGDNPGIPGSPDNDKKDGPVQGRSLSRGAWVGKIVAQILTLTCQKQPTQAANNKGNTITQDLGGLP